MINRLLEIPADESLFLFGPRQTGKSTLLRHLFPDSKSYWYDLLKSEIYHQLSAAPELFREQVLHRGAHIDHIVVDEIQRVPALLNEIHWLMEQANAPHFILTGSSARKLKADHVNLLGGRALTFHLHPLSYEEIGEPFPLHKVLQYGSIPGIFTKTSEESMANHLRAYTDTYLKEEIEREAKLKNLSPFIRFLNFAGAENGAQVNFSNIARAIGVSYQTVKSYYQLLEDTLMGFFLYPYTDSTRKRLSKQPKFYFFDTGVVRSLNQTLSVPLTPKSDAFGKAFEHFLILELMRKSDYSRLDFRFSYYRTAAGAEVDLIIEKPNGEVIALEIKSSDRIQPKHLRGLKSFKVVCPEARLICACTESFKRHLDGVEVMPWQEVIGRLFHEL
jgi:predicted AAA+ superfamily ATPase